MDNAKRTSKSHGCIHRLNPFPVRHQVTAVFFFQKMFYIYFQYIKYYLYFWIQEPCWPKTVFSGRSFKLKWSQFPQNLSNSNCKTSQSMESDKHYYWCFFYFLFFCSYSDVLKCTTLDFSLKEEYKNMKHPGSPATVW